MQKVFRNKTETRYNIFHRAELRVAETLSLVVSAFGSDGKWKSHHHNSKVVRKRFSIFPGLAVSLALRRHSRTIFCTRRRMSGCSTKCCAFCCSGLEEDSRSFKSIHESPSEPSRMRIKSKSSEMSVVVAPTPAESFSIFICLLFALFIIEKCFSVLPSLRSLLLLASTFHPLRPRPRRLCSNPNRIHVSFHSTSIHTNISQSSNSQSHFTSAAAAARGI